ncbi:MAG: hypothetical protein GY816_00190 [Cytophagales bacterium]|nr:hypothetical protein [Cytophagales bacterium]
MSRIKGIFYYRKDLVRFFVEYNTCMGSEYVAYERERDLFNLTISPRMTRSSLIIENMTTVNSPKIDLGSNIGFGVGLEAELILPFNKNKWAILIEPTYQYFESTKSTNVDYLVGGKLITNVKYKSVDVPVGFRHYFC